MDLEADALYPLIHPVPPVAALVIISSIVHLPQVLATDLDLGPNADLTFALRPYGSRGCADVSIDLLSGDVSLNGSAMPSEDCSVLVTACDHPLDVSQR